MSDQGKEFANATMIELCLLGELEHTFSAPYNPQANRAERFHKDLGPLLTIGLLEDIRNWIEKLAAITLAHNTKVHASTGCTPSEAFLGRQAKLPLELIVPPP